MNQPIAANTGSGDFPKNAPVRGWCLAASLAVAVLIAAPGASRGQAAGDPGGFMATLGNQVIQLIGNRQQPAAQRKQQFAQLVNQSFDVDGIARFVLGRYWRTASDSERQQFKQVFDTYMIDVYWGHFNQYTGQRFVVTTKRPVGEGTTLVTSQIIQPSGQQPVNVVWRVSSHNGKYQITDVSIEGVSELVTYRQEFASAISQNGGNVATLINQLRQKDQQIGGQS
ncbi:MAG: ABC transporter substrate-binding protein [Alphaproteobacteria bacterium]|nr:ABC transporter substrate-binding protein [Alphaproteobacteria bacterium]